MLFLSGGPSHGPTLVIDQCADSDELGCRGWTVCPKQGRLLLFDGALLHGVLPGTGALSSLGGDPTTSCSGREATGADPGSSTADECRITLMMAWWRKGDMEVQSDQAPGPMRAPPWSRGRGSQHRWPDEFGASGKDATGHAMDDEAAEDGIMQVSPVWVPVLPGTAPTLATEHAPPLRFFLRHAQEIRDVYTLPM